MRGEKIPFSSGSRRPVQGFVGEVKGKGTHFPYSTLSQNKLIYNPSDLKTAMQIVGHHCIQTNLN